MPFGAELMSTGGAEFRIWAPGAAQVELLRTAGSSTQSSASRVVEAHPQPVPMTRCEDGWHRHHVPHARPGDRYHYRIDGGLAVPDPASRFQPVDVHGPSELIDPLAFDWGDAERHWRGHPWHQAVIYELHVGTFSAGGDYAGIEARLDHLVELGITMIELMPLADFPGQRNWGYDGALLYAPDASYGRPDDLKRLVRAAHHRGLSVLLDVVYNHFGPEGNYLHCYAPTFFHADRHTPWGAAINFDGPDAGWVREFFIHNALYWIDEYRFDGLRLDAVDRIEDDSRPDILDTLAERVRNGLGCERPIHLILENDHNDTRRYQRDDAGRPQHFTAQWNDDLHHALHCLLTEETDGPYQDFGPAAPRSATALTARALAEGFAYQGERSAFRDGRRRGTPDAHLPPAAVVNFLQNHDQAGNRAFGERLHQLIQPKALDAALALVLLAPSPPLLFMGEEFDATSPFLFFCDFSADLADAVREGRRREFARSARFADPEIRRLIPDPNDRATFERSRLDWRWRDAPEGGSAISVEQRRFAHCRALLARRRERITPLIPLIEHGGDAFELGSEQLAACWDTNDGRRLQVAANLSPEPLDLQRTLAPPPAADIVLDLRPAAESISAHPTELPPWSVRWTIAPAGR